ncbi:hypothetical protein ACFRJ1_29700 [Streptomyces sp. NPDC056773]|uniref:hypothetical protein n=1 Tax=unclassified Streptomyces TaxID=2593676 RepID=UPI00369AB795
MSQHERGPQVTVIERLTTPLDPAAFARELVAYARRREGRKGLEALVTAESLTRPGTYLHLDRWSSLDRLLQVSHEGDESAARLPGLGSGTGVHSELMVGAGRMTARGKLVDAAHVVFVHAVLEGDPERFELDFGALVGQCVPDAGFGGSFLLRSAADPRAYTGMLWWLDPEGCEQVRSGAGYLDRLTKLTASARITEEPARLLWAA